MAEPDWTTTTANTAGQWDRLLGRTWDGARWVDPPEPRPASQVGRGKRRGVTQPKLKARRRR